MPYTVTETTFLPSDHVASLKQIEAGYWWFLGRIFWAQNLISKNPETYADIGCGTGGFAKALHRQLRFRRAVLVDSDPNIISAIGDHSDFEVLHSDFSKLELSFLPQLVTCMDVIEHIKNDLDFLRRIYEIQPSKGQLILSVPAMPMLFSEWDRVVGHHRRYTQEDLFKKLSSVGYKVRFISHMWSFMLPLFPYRLWKQKGYRDKAEFERVPNWINNMLIFLSHAEYYLSKSIRIPLGTSLIVSAVKP